MKRLFRVLILPLLLGNAAAWVSFPKQPQTSTAILPFLESARKLGPVGTFRSMKDQDDVLSAAKQLSGSDPRPADVPLQGVHRLVYSGAPGASSGKLFGKVAGQVTQTFVNSTHFINAVEWGPLKIELLARRQRKNAKQLDVFFEETTIRVFGQPVSSKRLPGTSGGSWKYLWVGVVEEGSNRKLVRVMETPSLFVLEHVLDDNK
ncbi:hypothetical protein FisN_13Lh362 [Fistulifera solaris]|uniref:Plastid lipid-associated protein/fibrillin conserved domain-containing protein n=1 Tax=Fistulifera solaris TaxID=1519565 RepID=A0A1Z5KLA3_FISSO|nr:hypothetical protein FisN_13Lh362 [Fistulifera solaris]|eukprot:GAX27094.1 hypothetical protein FisN_13Lh362 [Fistulifera solaris]